MLCYDFTSTILTAAVGKKVTMDVLQKIGDSASEGWAEGHARLVRRTKLHLRPGEALQLQMFMDFSVLEVFFGDGQVLSTRVYRGEWAVPEGSVESGAGEHESVKIASIEAGDAAVARGCCGVQLLASTGAGASGTTGGVLADISMHVMKACWDIAGQAEAN